MRVSGPDRSPAAALVAAILCLAVLGGCSGEDPPTDAGQDVTVLQPGRPGEGNATVAPDDVDAESGWNHADEAFMQMMVPHHAQALQMARLAPARAADPRVKRLAERILGAQRVEILAMSAWLEDRGLPVPSTEDDPSFYDHGSHGHNGMHGMLTAEQMTKLQAARGRQFDRLFLRGMIAHHRGALTMAADVAREGEHLRVNELADDITATQTYEINRMTGLLEQL